MLAQLLGTLSGVVIGGGLTFLASYVNERSKWNRSQAARWDERRLQAYTEYLIVTRRMHSLGGRLVAERRAPAGTGEFSISEAIANLAEFEAERSQRWQEVQLLGSADAVAIGDELNRCTWAVEWFAEGKLTDESDWQLLVREAYHLRKKFGTAARADLEVTGADLPVPEWHDEWTPREHLIAVRARSQGFLEP